MSLLALLEQEGARIGANIAALRADIGQIKGDIEELEAYPQSLEEAKTAVDRFIDRQAKEFDLEGKMGYFTNPGYSGERLLSEEHFIPNQLLSLNSAPLLAALLPDLLRKRMHQILAEKYKRIDSALTFEQRRARKKELEKRLFDLETDEERLICEAEQAGLEGVYRRADCNPVVVLGIFEDEETNGEAQADDAETV